MDKTVRSMKEWRVAIFAKAETSSLVKSSSHGDRVFKIELAV
jgi:hypothetical protein